MGYCNVEDVQAVVDTDMETHEIQDLIDETDVFMDLKLNTGSLGDMVKRAISRTWTAYRVMLKDPASETLDGHSESRAVNLKRLEAMYKEMIVDASTSGGIVFKMTSSPIG